jgi:DNA-binding LytR/AlgR family response regulator
MEELQMDETLLEFDPESSLVIICKGRLVSLDVDEITHASKFGNEIVIYTLNNTYRTYHSLQEILNVLPPDRFFRIHRSHIISLQRMDGVKKKRIKVGSYYLPVSDYYKARLCNRLQIILNENRHFSLLYNKSIRNEANL